MNSLNYPPWRYESQNGIQTYIYNSLKKLNAKNKYLKYFKKTVDLSDAKKLRSYFCEKLLECLKKIIKENLKSVSLMIRTCCFLLEERCVIEKISDVVNLKRSCISVNKGTIPQLIKDIITNMYDLIYENRDLSKEIGVGLFLIGSHYETVSPIKALTCYMSSYQSGYTLVAGLIASKYYSDLLTAESCKEGDTQKQLFFYILKITAQCSLDDGKIHYNDLTLLPRFSIREYSSEKSPLILLSCYDTNKRVTANAKMYNIYGKINGDSCSETLDGNRSHIKTKNNPIYFESLDDHIPNLEKEVRIAHKKITISDAWRGLFGKMSFFMDIAFSGVDDYLLSFSITLSHIGKFIAVKSITQEEKEEMGKKPFDEMNDEEKIKKWYHCELNITMIESLSQQLMYIYKKHLFFFDIIKREFRVLTESCDKIYTETSAIEIYIDVLYRTFLLIESIPEMIVEKKSKLLQLYNKIEEHFELSVRWTEVLIKTEKNFELVKFNIEKHFYHYNQCDKHALYKDCDQIYKNNANKALHSLKSNNHEFLLVWAIINFQKADYFEDKESVYHLARLYENSERLIPDNMSYSLLYYRIAERNNDARAIFKLAKFYLDGKVVERNFETALKLLTRAVSLKHGPSMCLQAYIHSKGIDGVLDKSINLSVELYTQALKRGNRLAAFHLAMLFQQSIKKESHTLSLTDYICSLYLFAIFGKSTITLENLVMEKAFSKKKNRMIVYSFLHYLFKNKSSWTHFFNGDLLSKWFTTLRDKFIIEILPKKKIK